MLKPVISKSGFGVDGRLVFIVIFVISALYMLEELNRGWIPHDDGTLGQSAERVLQGEVPHRDFDEIYTGGLSYLNTAAFRMFGTRLSSLRYMLYAFFLAWVPAMYYCATRFVSPVIAGAVTLIAVAWGPPNYAAAMPSWYNLFFATFGIAAVLHYIETQSWFWLFLAGLCGGTSFLFKVSGLYFIAGVLLFFVSLRAVDNEPHRANTGETGGKLYRRVLLLSVLAYILLLFAFLRKGCNQATLFYFLAPELALAAAIIRYEYVREAKPSRESFSSVFRRIIPFASGIAVPIAVFLVPYFATGAVSRFLYGVFVLPGKRFAFAVHPHSLPDLAAALAVDTAAIGLIFSAGKSLGKASAVRVGLAAAILLVTVRYVHFLYRVIWSSIWTLLPVVVIVGLIVLARSRFSEQLDEPHRQRVFLLLSVTAACSLIQFPFSAAIYFCYVAPLLILAATAVLSIARPLPPAVLVCLLVFFLLYPVLDVTPGFVYKMGSYYVPDIQKAAFDLPRAQSLRIAETDATEYKDLANIVSAHAHGSYIYCTADCPEIYFLFGFRNPTRTLFDFFDDPAGRTARILAGLQSHNVNLVVLSLNPPFSGRIPRDLREAVERDFPNHAATNRFEVRWRP